MSNKGKIRTTNKAVIEYLKLWNDLYDYKMQEKSLNKLFMKTYPKNNKLDEILIKVSSLNDFYSTNIFKSYYVALHILSLKIDNRLNKIDPTLVEDIAKVKMNGAIKNLYSFATKYCSHHKPNDYPIYDGYVEKVLIHLKRRDQFSSFIKKDLRNYSSFKNILKDFSSYYGLTKFSMNQIDKYLWLVGKEYFPKKYY